MERRLAGVPRVLDETDRGTLDTLRRGRRASSAVRLRRDHGSNLVKARSKSARIAAQLADLRMPGALGGPAPVAPPPPRRLPKSVQFSIVRSVQFSTVIDTALGQHVESFQATRQLPAAQRIPEIILCADATPQRPATRKLLVRENASDPVHSLGTAQGPLDLRLRPHSVLCSKNALQLSSPNCNRRTRLILAEAHHCCRRHVVSPICGYTGALASHLLACVERQLSRDWQDRYKTCPVLLETFCETPRFAGTCYRAANWTLVGQTQGRGKLDTRHEYAKPVKNIFVKPLCPDWKAILNR